MLVVRWSISIVLIAANRWLLSEWLHSLAFSQIATRASLDFSQPLIDALA